MESTEHDLSEELSAETMAEVTEVTGPVSHDRAHRYYDRIRESIRQYLQRKANLGDKASDYLLLVPDIFILLWRLVNDARVNGKNKVLLGSGIAYYLFPLDMLPEAILGPMGYMDDLVFGVYLLNKMLADTDPEVLRKHWSGSQDILQSIQGVLNAADQLLGKDMVTRVKKLIK